MKHWYDRYMEVYGREWTDVSPERLRALKEKIAARRTDSPVASVVAIAHNEATHLVACLESLCDNKTHFPLEFIVVNNCSTDSTEQLLRHLGVTYFNEAQRGPGHARQRGLDEARGKYLLCIDSDTVYPPHYIRTMVDALRQPGTACAYALWSFYPDAHHSSLALCFYEFLRDLYLCLQQLRRPELNVRGMVFAFPTELGRRHGFRTDIIRGEDGSLALAMKGDGCLRLVTSRRARPVTGYGPAQGQGSGVAAMLWARAKKAFLSLSHLFVCQDHYTDEPNNLL